MYVGFPRWYGSFLYVPTVNTAYLHWRSGNEYSRHDSLALDFCLPEIMMRFPYVICRFFFPFHLDSLFTWNWLLILFPLDEQLIKKHLLIIYFLAARYWVSEWMNESDSVVSNSFQPHGLYSAWNSPGQNTGVGSLSLLKPGIELASPALHRDSLPSELSRKSALPVK